MTRENGLYADDISRRFGHVPVLAREAVAALAPVDGGVYVDATMGGGGYTRLILEAADCTVYAFDRDPAAVERAAGWAGAYGNRLHIVQRAFDEMEEGLAEHGVSAVDGIVFDLGVSSPQLDEGERGFSFAKDGPLNMRMDQAGEHSAEALVNEASEKDLADIFYIYGEEKKSRGIARAIVRARQDDRITRTGQLAEIIAAATGPRGKEKIHPATRAFQAIRIFINDELGQLVRGLVAAESLLKPTARLAVVTFHSLEDRIVKRFFALRGGKTGGGSRHQPIVEAGPAPAFESITGKAIAPGAEEVAANPRARSSRLRAGTRTDAPAGLADEDLLSRIGLPRPVFSSALSSWT